MAIGIVLAVLLGAVRVSDCAAGQYHAWNSDGSVGIPADETGQKVPQDPRQKKRVPPARYYKPEEYRKYPPKPSPAPEGHVSTRIEPESSVYFNSGRWTAYDDGIYLEPQEDTVYIITSPSGAPLQPDKPDDLYSITAHIFAEYRAYADSVCPVEIGQKLGDPEFRKQVEERYEQVRESQLQFRNRSVSFEEFLAETPNCEVRGNLWRMATKFAELDEEQHLKRMMVRFPNSIEIQPFLSPAGGESQLPLLKTRLRQEGKFILSPLSPRTAP